MTGSYSLSCNRRPGISLLEIMISIGVVGIGLIGVASLIPLAHFKAAQGVEEERQALFGKRAVREFFIRDFHRPGTNVRPYWIHDGRATGWPSVPIRDTQGKLLTQTYCFDPHGVAANFNVMFFPDTRPPNVQAQNVHVPRITVLQTPASRFQESILASPPYNPVRRQQAVQNTNLFVNQVPVIGSPLADEIFRIRDDIVVELPDNQDEIARRTMLRMDQAPFNGTYVKPSSSGSFSWMATLKPELQLELSVGPHVPNRYVLSMVIFHQRDLSGTYREETIAQVISLFDGFQGAMKEVTIDERQFFDPTTPQNVGVRDIREGDWIAVVQNQHPSGVIVPQNPTLPAVNPNLVALNWYQVTSADEVTGPDDQPEINELVNGVDMTRELTLSGPDWVPLPNRPVFVIYLRNVATVYEKTIELER